MAKKKNEGLVIEAKVLAGAMRHAASIVAPSNTLPILSNVLLRANGDALELAASDMDVELALVVPVVNAGDLDLTVEAKRLADLANAADSGSQISLAPAEGGRLEVRSGRSRWQLPFAASSDFPLVEFAPGDFVKVSGRTLTAAIGRVIDSVLVGITATARANLSGVYIHQYGSAARFVATDGLRFAMVSAEMAWPKDAPGVILLPKFLNALSSLIGDGDAEVELGWTDRRIMARGDGWRLIGKVVDSEFPDYQRIVPKRDEEPLAVFENELMRRALKRVQLMQERDGRIAFTFSADKITLEASGADGLAQEEIPAECSREAKEFFHGGNIAKGMQQIGGDTVRWQYAGDKGVARLERVVEDGMMVLIMPMRG